LAVTDFYQQKLVVNTIHTFKVDGIEGGTIDFAALAGKKILVVNVASECGLTPQYQQLQELYEEFGDKLTIVGFPAIPIAIGIGAQEPGSNHEIQSFCTRRYGVLPTTCRDRCDHPPSVPMADAKIAEWRSRQHRNLEFSSRQIVGTPLSNRAASSMFSHLLPVPLMMKYSVG
jgi:Glutathione peroxidase